MHGWYGYMNEWMDGRMEWWMVQVVASKVPETPTNLEAHIFATSPILATHKLMLKLQDLSRKYLQLLKDKRTMRYARCSSALIGCSLVSV